MPVSIVTAPDGKQYEVTHPEGASQDEVISFAQQQAGQQAGIQGNPPGTIDADDPLLVDVAKGLFTGTSEATVNTIAGITQWAGQSFGSDSMLEAAEDMRQYGQGIGEKVGLDKEFGESLPGQVFRGIGQFPVTVAAGAAGFAAAGPVGMVGAAALTTGGQMSTEFLNDMEQTVGKGYTDFNQAEKDQALKGMLAQTAIGTALETAAVGKIMGPVLRKLATGGVSNKVLKEAIKKQKGALREMSEAAGAEGLTEALQGQSLDTIASLLYDEDRELVSLDVLRQRSMEFAVGSIVGGTISGGVQLIGGAPSAPSGGTKADLKKPVQERSELTIPDAVTVTYKPIDGPVKTVSLAIDPGQDPRAAVEEELAGRYDRTYPMKIDTVSAPVPVGPEQELDLPDQAPDTTQDEVPVQPEAAVPTQEQAPVEQAPVEQVLPEVVPQVVPATEQAPEAAPVVQEQAPAVRGNFRISRRMSKSQPTYSGQQVAYKSDLELAVYMATGKGKNASNVRSELIEAGYSPAEINAMGKEVRAQMKEGYNSNSSEPISVAIAQDVTAEAAGVDRRTMSFTDVTKRTPEIQEQAKILRENIKAGDREQSRRVAEAADKFKPVHAYDFVPAPETNSDMLNALDGDERKSKLNTKVPEGKEVAIRLDINAYTKKGVWVPVVHEQKGNSFQAGTPLSYQSTAVITDVKFGVASDLAVLNIATGKSKSTIATIRGTYKNVTPTQAKKMAEKALKDPSYVQVGMDPERRGYFYNRETMQEVVAGDQAIQVGPLVLVKNPQYGATPSNEWLSLGPDVVAEAAPLKAKAKKITRDYDLLSSPFISNYSGPGPTDTSVPDYGSFHYVVSNPQQQELNAAIASGAVDNLADQVANEAAAMMNDPAIAAGIGWYGRMRQRLSQIFGNDLSIFTQLLGTTSAQTPVETNFRFSVDLYNRFKAGEFDANIKEYLKLYGQMKAGTLGDLLLKDKVKNSKGVLYTPEMIKKSEPSALLSSAAEHYNLEPTQTSGKKYGTNSYPALKALAQVWFNERLSKDKMTPKTPQFTMNLNGESLEATIDVWAARLLRRVIYAGQADSRILPSQETAVNNPDFALGQLVFRRAAQKLNMNPDDFQALVWFGEKQIWDRNGWTGAAGALKSSFDEPADVFYPVDGSTRSEADANLILDFLAKERLVKRDIEFPDAVAKTRQNENRKEYDKFLRQRVISDYLKSRGSGAVYESSSVESNRKRQVTRSINRLSSYTGKVSYKKGTGKEPKGSLKVVKRGPVLGENRFARIAKANKDGNKFGSSVDVFKASDYKGYDLIITSSERGESVTIAISPDGELSSVTKSSNATAQDVDAAFDMAISTGKVKFLNGFETILPDKYASYGFTPVARLKFDPEFQPDGWSTQTYRNFNGGQPDVVFMRFDGTVGSEYDGTGFPEVDTYEEGVRLANQEDVTAQAAQPEVEDRGPRDTYDNGGQVQDAIEKEFDPIGKKINTPIVMRMGKTDYVARYNATRGIIEYNPMLLLKRSIAGIRAAMREEIIHAAMHQVLMIAARKKFSMAEGGKVWTDFFDAFGKTLTAEERSGIMNMYTGLEADNYIGQGSEYSRAVIQKLLYGEFSEQYVAVKEGGAAWNAIVQMMRSVQAYMAKVLGPMIKTNPEAAQVIVDTVELLKAADPSIRPKNQDVVAQAYDATDKNTAKENTEAGERVGQDASERIREERKWLDGAFRKTASKYLTPVITRLNRINPMFGRILQNLDSAIRMRSMGYRKQTEMFFNKLNAVKGAEFQELKQLMFFSPTPEEANLPSNKAKMQRRDALLHKHGLLNMYRLDVQPILEEIYTEYNELGMPKIGYLEDYFPRVIKDLEGLIKSYGHKTKRTFEMLVREENIRRSELKDADGNPAPLPEMQETERARFFQDFLQGKFRVDLNGVKLPGNVKAREIQLIPEDKLKFYDNPGIAFGKYTTNMSRAIESFKVVGDTKKGEGRLLGELGKLTEQLFTAGQIDEADANELKTLTELITSQFQAENEILKSLGTLTYMATLINPGPVLVQIMDLYKVALYRGLGGVVSGTYRTVTGNRRFDIEGDWGISKTQISAEFEDPSFLTKALDFGLSRLVPFRQMDVAMKHASIEAAYDDFVKKAKAPVGSKKYQQLLDELTVTMGREDALKTISDLRLDKAMESTLVKEALLAELLQRQPLTYLQVPEGYQTDPSKRLFYKLSTFMLLDLNYNRQEFMNDLGGPGKTLKQRTVALRRLTYMAALLTMFGLPSDLLDDWIAGKDTYIPEHVMNNMLGMFGLSRYTTSRALNKGAVESVIQRFTPPAINIMIDGEQSLRSWVKGDKELFDIKSWRNSPLSDVWYYRTGGGVESQRKYQKKQRKEGITPTFDR